MNDTIIFYDRNGHAVVYLFRREIFYSFQGQPLGYVDRTGAIYWWDGRYLGFWQEGWIRDAQGFCLAFQRDAVGGADKPRCGPRPEWGGREPVPARAKTEPAPERAMKIANWSELTVKTFFR
jgi:hypothetical protein